MKRIINILDHYGIHFRKPKRKLGGIVFLTNEETEERKNKFIKNLENYSYSKTLSESHLEYLRGIVEEENSRLNTIETKIGQIIGQAGILLALISLFAPLFYDQLKEFTLLIKIIIFALFLFGFIFFMISIFQATKSLNIINFIYIKPSAGTVLNPSHNTYEKFLQVQITDLINGINHNIDTNNIKGNVLLYAHRAFRTGLVLIGSLGVLIIGIFTFKSKPENVVIFENTPLVQSLDNKTEDLSRAFDILKQEILKLKEKSISQQDSIVINNIHHKLDSLSSDLNKLRNRVKDTLASKH